MNKILDKILVAFLLLLVATGVFLNIQQQLSVDQSKLPTKVEDHSGFQRWITNLKNKGLEHIDADEFRLKEENEIYNTKWLKIYALDEKGREQEYNETMVENRDIDKVIYSLNEKLFIDYRNEPRSGYKPNEVHLYGIKEDKILDARIVDCSSDANCYFDRAYFINNDVFVISEFSRNIDDEDESVTECLITEACEYTIKVHVIDLLKNSRLVYESKPFNIILRDLIPEL